jgi:phosphatidate cytidylyltransferase
MRERAISGAVLVPVLLIVLAIGGPAIALAIVLITVAAAIEVFRLLHAAGHDAFPALGVVLAVTIVLDAAFPDVLDGSGLLLSAIGLVLIGVAAMTREVPRAGLVAWIATVFGAFYVSLLAFVIRLGNTAPPIPDGAPFEPLGAERGWILLLILAVWSFDTGAFLVGRQFGRTRFITHISPAKTVEGVAGGVVATTVVLALLLWGLGQSPAHALVLGPLAALAAQAGDLAESMLKRAADAKDSGTLIPGHGGILDRIDSFLFAAPVVSLYVVAVLS